MLKVKASDIQSEVKVCCFCGDEWMDRGNGCCGEVRYEMQYEVDGEWFSENEVDIIKEVK